MPKHNNPGTRGNEGISRVNEIPTRPPVIRFWEKARVLDQRSVDYLRTREATVKHCSLCGKISHWYVGKSGFCEEHRAEAYAAQAAYFKAKYQYILKSIGRY